MKRAASIVVAAATLLQACSTPTMAPRLEAAVPPAWSASAASGSTRALNPTWWHDFGDPVLDRLVEQALAHNTDLRSAAARVAEARALVTVQRAAGLPTLDLGVATQRSRSISAVTGEPYLSTVTQPQFQAAYEVDLWGRIAALDRAASAQLQASETAGDSAALSVAATTVNGYVALRALDARLQVARDTLTSRENAVRLRGRASSALQLGAGKRSRARPSTAPPPLSCHRSSWAFAGRKAPCDCSVGWQPGLSNAV